MNLNESEMCDSIAFRESEIAALDINQVSIWVAKHRAAKKRRHELNRHTTHLFQHEILKDVRRKMLEREIRLVQSLEINLSVKSMIKDSMKQAIENVGVGMWTARSQDRIKRYQQELTEHSLGRAWVDAFERVKRLDKVVLEEKEIKRSAEDEFEKAIKGHEAKVQKLKNDIRRIAPKRLD